MISKTSETDLVVSPLINSGSENDGTLSALYARLGYTQINRTWAKTEIFIGLCAAGSGLLLGEWVLQRSLAEIDWSLTTVALALFVLGGYLTLAGLRSHIYQSCNELTAYLVGEFRSIRAKV
jgi:hypothetical protein